MHPKWLEKLDEGLDYEPERSGGSRSSPDHHILQPSAQMKVSEEMAVLTAGAGRITLPAARPGAERQWSLPDAPRIQVLNWLIWAF